MTPAGSADPAPQDGGLSFPRAVQRSDLRLLVHSVGASVVHLRGLRFPFTVSVQICEGACSIEVPGQMLAGSATRVRIIEPLEVPRVTLAGQAQVSFRALAGDALRAPLHSGRMPHARTQKPVASALALAVFSAPHWPWGRDTASTALRFHSSSRLSRALMQEGESFADLVTTQRLMRFLFDACCYCRKMPDLAHYGFPDHCALDIALHEHFGVMPQLLRRMLSAVCTPSCACRTAGAG